MFDDQFQRSGFRNRYRIKPRLDGCKLNEESRGSKGRQEPLGRSRGGFPTKIHLKTGKHGHLIAFDLTGGEKGGCPHFPVLLDPGPGIKPRAGFGGKGYDSKANRALGRSRSMVPVIPQKSTAKNKPKNFPHLLYKARPRIEIAVGKLKRFKRIALRCEKTAKNFASFVAISAGFILIKSVHTA